MDGLETFLTTASVVGAIVLWLIITFWVLVIYAYFSTANNVRKIRHELERLNRTMADMAHQRSHDVISPRHLPGDEHSTYSQEPQHPH